MEHGIRHNHEHDVKSYGGYDSILRQRLSSTSSDSGIGVMGSSPPTNSLDKMYSDEIKTPNPCEAIPLHWKSIPMPWK